MCKPCRYLLLDDIYEDEFSDEVLKFFGDGTFGQHLLGRFLWASWPIQPVKWVTMWIIRVQQYFLCKYDVFRDGFGGLIPRFYRVGMGCFFRLFFIDYRRVMGIEVKNLSPMLCTEKFDLKMGDKVVYTMRWNDTLCEYFCLQNLRWTDYFWEFLPVQRGHCCCVS